MWDNGFPRGPEDRVGMLFWRMHRAADSKTMTLKAFNDAFLREGEMPIDIMCAALASQPLQTLTRGYTTQWKYYGDVPDARQ
jgi:hypothetical protein